MRSFGRERYTTVNAFLNKSLANHPFAIAAHRGAPRGDIRDVIAAFNEALNGKDMKTAMKDGEAKAAQDIATYNKAVTR